MEENQETNVEEIKKSRFKNVNKWHISTAVLGVLFIISLFTGGFGLKDTTGSASVTGDLNVIALNDERCKECDVTGLVAQLKILFPNMNVEEMDYNDKEGKKLYEDSGLEALPAVLFTEKVKEEVGYSDVAAYMETKGDFLSLKIGAVFDPESEICDNNIDDDEDSLIDCSDNDCSSEWQCMEKKDKPEVELFVMSHCPYGTQAEKGIIPVVELLGNKINFEVKFCDYAMHGLEEINEEKNQYCIQKEQGSKFLSYLKCFLKDGKGKECLSEIGIDEKKLNSCVSATDKQFKITENYNDKTTWKGSYPSFDVNKEEVIEYGVRGSPTLVINGVVASTGRDPVSLLKAVCTGFKNEPTECSQSLSNASPVPGFGFEATSTSGATDTGACA